MNKTTTIFIVLLLSFFSLNVYGQKRGITKDNFLTAQQKANERVRDIPHRLISISHIYTNDGTELQVIRTETSEVESPERRRFVIEYNEVYHDRKSSSEKVFFDGIQYQKSDDGSWTKKNFAIPQIGANASFGDDANYYLTEDVLVNDKTADLFGVETEIKARTAVYKGNEVKVNALLQKIKMWRSKDGKLLKFEISKQHKDTENPAFRQTIIYEYDSNIKIEAPIKK